jgi:hypothetical protein
VNMVMSLQVSYKVRNFLTSWANISCLRSLFFEDNCYSGRGLEDQVQFLTWAGGMGRNFLFATMPMLTPGTTQPQTQWVVKPFSLREKWPEHETGHSPLSSTKVKNVWSFSSTPSICLHGVMRRQRNIICFNFITCF